MVKVIGKAYRDDGSSFKVNENFRTQAEADKFKKFIGRSGKVKVVRMRKKTSRSNNPWDFFRI